MAKPEPRPPVEITDHVATPCEGCGSNEVKRERHMFVNRCAECGQFRA